MGHIYHYQAKTARATDSSVYGLVGKIIPSLVVKPILAFTQRTDILSSDSVKRQYSSTVYNDYHSYLLIIIIIITVSRIYNFTDFTERFITK